ncbi:MAG: aminotransferase class IV [Opitutales bacterium]
MSAIIIIRPGEELAVNPVAAGFAHGLAIFETIRLRQGRLEFWASHWQRLAKSARALDIQCPFIVDTVLGAIHELAGELSGEGTIKLSLLKEGGGSRLIVYSRPSFPKPERVGLLLGSAFRLNDLSPLAGHKTHNYAESALALAQARELGCYDTLRLNTREAIAEAAVSNVFFVQAGCLRTPPEASGLLPGVVRDALLGGIGVDTSEAFLEDISSAEAVYLTNSSVGVLPVDYLLKAGEPHELSSAAHPAYAEMQSVLEAQLESGSVVL